MSAGLASFPWEAKRALTVLTFKSLVASTANPTLLGPLTLRKSTGPLPPNVLQDLSRMAQRQSPFNLRRSPLEAGAVYVRSGQHSLTDPNAQLSDVDAESSSRATSPSNSNNNNNNIGPRSTAFSPLSPLDSSFLPRSRVSSVDGISGRTPQQNSSHNNRHVHPPQDSPQPSEHSDGFDGRTAQMTADPKRRTRTSTGASSDTDGSGVAGPATTASRSKKIFSFFKGK